MKKRFGFLCALCTVLLAAGFATRTALNQTSKRPAYTIVWQETSYDGSGTAFPESTETRYVSANGNWFSVKNYADGKTEEMFAIVGKGVYLKRGQTLYFMSDFNLIPQRTADGMKSKNHYQRTENVLGLPVVVINPDGDTQQHLEMYFAPALNAEIKTVIHGARTLVKEPISLTFGEPDPKLFNFPDELKVDYSNYERLHGPRKSN
jgi:hypothetical protein